VGEHDEGHGRERPGRQGLRSAGLEILTYCSDRRGRSQSDDRGEVEDIDAVIDEVGELCTPLDTAVCP
jgi:hypothetical protein